MKGFSSPENFRFSQVALGDGSGNGYQPEPDSTSLRQEMQRIEISSVVVQDSARLHITAVAGLPGENDSAEPFDIREIGFYLQAIAESGEDEGEPILFAIYATEVDDNPLLTKEPSTELLLAFDLLLPDISEGDFKFDKDSYLHLPTADQARSGMVRLASNEETNKGTAIDCAVTPGGLQETLEAKTVSPEGLKTALDNLDIPESGGGFDGNADNINVTGTLSFGAEVRQMINLWHDHYGIGVQSYTQYFRSDKNFAWYKKGAHNNAELNPGNDGIAQMVLNDGKLGIGINDPAAHLDTPSIRVRTQSFKVGGDFKKFYPIVFQDDGWYDGAFTLELTRANVHEDSQWRGSLVAKFSGHSNRWGHGSDYLEAQVHQNKVEFIADFKNIVKGPQFVVWLRGGNTTYHWRSNQPTVLADAKAAKKVVAEETLTVLSAAKPQYKQFNYKVESSPGEPWIAAKLQNKWKRYSSTYNPPGYYKDNAGIVRLRGLVKEGAISKPIFTLPVGYRPQFRELQATQTHANTIGRLDVLSNGQVIPVKGGPGWFSLDGVTFRAV